MLPDEMREDKVLNEFKKLVGDLNIGDAELRRFLRARNHDVQRAEDMLRKCVEWRKAIYFDEAMTWEIPDVVRDSFPFFFDGLDNDGRIVLYFPVGRWEVRKMITSGWKSEMERYLYSTMASLMKTIDNSGWDQFVVIIDLAELTHWKIAHYETMQMVLKVFRDYEQNFPERLHHALVINAPWVLNCIFPVIKPLLTGRTMQKVQFFDSNSTKYLPAILDLAPVQNLPSGFLEYNDEIIQTHITTCALT